MEYSESMKVEVSHMSSILERRALSVQEKENALLEVTRGICYLYFLKIQVSLMNTSITLF